MKSMRRISLMAVGLMIALCGPTLANFDPPDPNFAVVQFSTPDNAGFEFGTVSDRASTYDLAAVDVGLTGHKIFSRPVTDLDQSAIAVAMLSHQIAVKTHRPFETGWMSNRS